MKTKHAKNVLVVCHDAGAAEILSAYVKKYADRFRFHCVAAGPAQKIFRRKALSSHLCLPERGVALLNRGMVDMVMCGTSWISGLERDMVQKAKARGIKSVVYLDHWTNYRERFGYPRKNWQKYLPDELWVGDRYAFNLAKRYFKNQTIKLVPNQYFQEVKSAFRLLRGKAKTKEGDILFMSEPTMLAHKTFYEAGYMYDETDVLKKVLDYLLKKNVQNTIVICYHPAETKGKYKALLARYEGTLRFRKQGRNVLKDFTRAQLVIGRRSMALALAALCGRHVVSYIPDRAVAFPLPFKEIINIRDINRLKV
ncbi:MAG: hypothetical protein HY471_01290 [Candidatus Sungbacteria bacterium]|nr:hypothetical protein [Candidatus Sungbacteria bacterium]